MKLGYARVSTTDQNLERQIEQLTAAGCAVFYQEKLSGKNDKRPQLHKMLSEAKEGDTIVVTKLDRLGRSLHDLIKIVNDLSERKVHFVSLGDNFDTSTPQGRFIFHMMGSLAEFERSMILERVTSGIAHAKIHGTKTGRPFGRVATKGTPENMEKLRTMVNQGYHVAKIAESLKVGQKEVYRYMRKLGISDLYKEKMQLKKILLK